MLYSLIGAIGLSGLFLYLFIRSEIANGNLKSDIKRLTKDVETAKKQLEAAANHPDTPASLAKRMRDGTL